VAAQVGAQVVLRVVGRVTATVVDEAVGMEANMVGAMAVVLRVVSMAEAGTARLSTARPIRSPLAQSSSRSRSKDGSR